MTRSTLKALAAGLVAGACALAVAAAAPGRVATHRNAVDIDWNAVAQAVGVPDSSQAGGVFRDMRPPYSRVA